MERLEREPDTEAERSEREAWAQKESGTGFEAGAELRGRVGKGLKEPGLPPGFRARNCTLEGRACIRRKPRSIHRDRTSA